MKRWTTRSPSYRYQPLVNSRGQDYKVRVIRVRVRDMARVEVRVRVRVRVGPAAPLHIATSLLLIQGVKIVRSELGLMLGLGLEFELG
jgi:hypothetical protein